VTLVVYPRQFETYPPVAGSEVSHFFFAPFLIVASAVKLRLLSST
jgi:hypothetical protein